MSQQPIRSNSLHLPIHNDNSDISVLHSRPRTAQLAVTPRRTFSSDPLKSPTKVEPQQIRPKSVQSNHNVMTIRNIPNITDFPPLNQQLQQIKQENRSTSSSHIEYIPQSNVKPTSRYRSQDGALKTFRALVEVPDASLPKNPFSTQILKVHNYREVISALSPADYLKEKPYVTQWLIQSINAHAAETQGKLPFTKFMFNQVYAPYHGKNSTMDYRYRYTHHPEDIPPWYVPTHLVPNYNLDTLSDTDREHVIKTVTEPPSKDRNHPNAINHYNPFGMYIVFSHNANYYRKYKEMYLEYKTAMRCLSPNEVNTGFANLINISSDHVDVLDVPAAIPLKGPAQFRIYEFKCSPGCIITDLYAIEYNPTDIQGFPTPHRCTPPTPSRRLSPHVSPNGSPSKKGYCARPYLVNNSPVRTQSIPTTFPHDLSLPMPKANQLLISSRTPSMESSSVASSVPNSQNNSPTGLLSGFESDSDDPDEDVDEIMKNLRILNFKRRESDTDIENIHYMTRM